MRVLLAEDDSLLGDGLRAGLRQLGFLVDWMRDGGAAERELLAQPYEAAVLDLGLPRKDGLDVLVAIRRARVLTPVLALTVATSALLVVHATTRPVSTLFNASRATAVACVLLPTVSVVDASVTDSDAIGTGVTTMIA